MNKYDVGIIGGGPAGYTSALYEAGLGKAVVLFEKGEIGGTCLNRGCIPTKLFIHASEVYKEMKDAYKIGINAENISFDYSKISAHKDSIVLKLRKSIELALKQAKVDLIKSTAKIVNNNIISDGLNEYECEKILVCTGSHPKEIKGLEYDHEFILNSDDILNIQKLPQNILIVGSGAIGIEWARILSNFDVNVTLTEIASQLCPLADWEVSKRIERQFKLAKIKYYTETYIKSVDKESHLVELSNGDTITTDCILVAAGRGVNLPDNINDSVTVLGDASGEIMLAHYAVSQAKSEVLNILFDKNIVPSVIYGTPEIAWIGKTFKTKEDENGYDISVYPVSALGKAHCDGCIDGFIKLVSKDNLILGASIVSKEASALIQQVAIAMHNNITINKLKEVCFAHPTYSEGILEGIMKL